MSKTLQVRRGSYVDSVTLMQVSRKVASAPGVTSALVAMATELNLDLARSLGFTLPDRTSPNEMLVAVDAADEEALAGALTVVDSALREAAAPAATSFGSAPQPLTVGAAARRGGAGVALISTPGEYAFADAVDAVDAGLHTMVFSDNVPLEQEVALKRTAADRGLLVMGPDCGTAVVGGVGLGFADTVAPGPVGVVAASGTGCQELLALLDHAGVGVAHALGVGGRDLSAEVGGLATREALRRLDADPAVELVVVVSKPPADAVAGELEEHAARLGTPVELALLGAGRPDLTAVAERVLGRLGREVPAWPVRGHAGPGRGGLLRGLFCGGTLCDEAMLVAREVLGPIRSNIPLSPDLALGPDLTADAHLMIDFGDDALTQGRAHPMIDPGLRLEHLARHAADPRTGVLLLDVVLGHGADPDPAASLAPALAAVDVPVLVALVGTTGDPQGWDRQAAALVESGAEVHLSMAAATRRAVELTGEGA